MASPAIILVDDSEDILELGASVLQSAGFTVMTAVSGDVALILLEERVPFQLMITDIVMPGFLDGFALARRAREFLPDIRVIYTTGYREIASVRSRGAPFGDILVKPWRPRQLLDMVGATLTGRRRAAIGAIEPADPQHRLAV